MSWDVYVLDLPRGLEHINDLPEDWSPGPLMPRDRLIAGIREVAPHLEFSEPTRGTLDFGTSFIDLHLPAEDPVESFSFSVAGGGGGVALIAAILKHLGLRAVATGSGDLLDLDHPERDFNTWADFRDRVIPESGRRPLE